ncbi:hypothetical protein [Clostridium butyricum]
MLVNVIGSYMVVMFIYASTIMIIEDTDEEYSQKSMLKHILELLFSPVIF